MRIVSILPFVIALSPLSIRAADAPVPGKTAGKEKKSDAPPPPSPEEIKKLVAAYPLTTCVVSGEKLEDGGDMGDVVNYIHREPGKPDRLVRLCCKGCVKDFKKDPAKYLASIDKATADKKTGK